MKLHPLKAINGRVLVAVTISLCVTHLFFTSFVFGQSETDPLGEGESLLILDGGLEIREPNINGDTLCPSSVSFIGILKYWNQAYGSVDYFHSCSNDQYPNFGVPSNLAGHQASRLTGDAYAGLGCYSPTFSDAREFITTELSQVLTENHKYRLSFYVSLADSMNYAVGKIGAYFSPTQTRGLPKDAYFDFEPQVVYDSTLLSDKENWTLISDEFIATGEEKFLTIGSFWRDDEMPIEQVGNSTNVNASASLYYLDDVLLLDVGSVDVGDELKLNKFKLFPNPVNKDGWFTVEYDLTSVNGATVEFFMFDGVGRQVKKMTLPFLSTRVDLAKDGLKPGVFQYQLLVNGRSVQSDRLVIQ